MRKKININAVTKSISLGNSGAAQDLLNKTVMISDHNIVQSNNTKDLGLILRPNPSCEETLFFRSHLILLSKDKQRPGQGLHPANRHEREPPHCVGPWRTGFSRGQPTR